MRPPIKFMPYRNHHGYFGIAFFLFGLYNYYLMIVSNELLGVKPIWHGCMLAGLVMIADDIIEHKITADTPLRIFFEKFLLPRL